MAHKECMDCKECGSNMYLDDRDTNFKGNYDNYWCCESCQTSCLEQVRFGQRFKEIWHSENNNDVKDYVIKHQINRNLDDKIANAKQQGSARPCGARGEAVRQGREGQWKGSDGR